MVDVHPVGVPDFSNHMSVLSIAGLIAVTVSYLADRLHKVLAMS